MRIYLISEEFPEETNYWWIWTYHYTLSSKLTYIWNDVSVICKTFNKSSSFINEHWVKVIRVKPFFWINNLFLYRIKLLFVIIQEQISKRIDVIESPEWNWEIFFYYFFNWFWKTKLILRLHTPLFVCTYLNNLNTNLSNRLNIFIEKYLIKNISTISCCSYSLLNEISKTYKINKNIPVIYNPWNDLIFDISKEYKDIYNLKSEKINILFSWSHEYRKWIDYFSKSMNIILNTYDNINIIFVWKYWDSWNLNQKLSKKEILNYFDYTNHEKIKFLWKVDYKTMPNVYKYCDICVFPSIYDNYPWVVIESLLMWKAVIASKNTGIVEAIKKWIIYIDPINISDIVEKTSSLINNREMILSLWDEWYKEVNKLNENILNSIIEFYK